MKKLLRRMLIWAAVLVLLCTTGLAEGGLHIVCTSFPCYDFVRAVATENDTVELLIRPGTEVHSYEPTTGDILAIADCDLFVCVGGESDAWVDDILDSLGSQQPEILRLMDCVSPVEEEQKEGMTTSGEEDAEAEYDEHIWTAPANAKLMVAAVAGAMEDLSDEPRYGENADAYIEEITEVESRIAEIVQGAQRKEMIFADRFPFLYFVRQFGLDYYAAFPSCSAESEPSAKTLAFLIEKVAEDQIPVIYTIEMSNQKTAQAVAEETGAQICTFYSAQTITEEDFSAGETYVTLMRRNAEALDRGLN